MMAAAELTHTATDLLDFFPAANGDGLNITWGHALNNKAQFEQALKGDVMMLETDIMVRGYGTSNPTNIPIHAHPPDSDSDLTVKEAIDLFMQVTNKGIKLDFKCIEALEPTLQILQQRKICAPILLNADIVNGPESFSTPVDPTRFIDTCNRYFPSAIMSLGFTTAWDCTPDASYTWEIITNLLYKVHRLPQHVTFPIRAVYLSTSWKRFLCVLGMKPSFSITVWSSPRDNVDMSGVVALRKYGGKDRVYVDLQDETMQQFKKALIDDDESTTHREVPIHWCRDLWFVDDTVPLPDNWVYLSTTGALFLSRNSKHSTSKRVHSKQAYEVVKTGTHPLEISGTLQFIGSSNSQNVSGETEFYVYISGTGESVYSDNTNDIIAMSISNSGKITLQKCTTQVTSTDSSLPESTTYEFTLHNIGVGLKPMVKVSAKCLNSDTVDLESNSSVEVALTEIVVVDISTSPKLSVSFCKVGTTKDLMLEDVVVKC
ncbi:protein FAM151A-like [Amphiura filiformis]|uniref:protein FAM151A-like n=1 Tax=Amphiura filiformis TaxID=82378 RepID=UPI003B2115A5